MRATLLLAACALAAIAFPSGCANPIGARTAETYFMAGAQAERAGDLVLAGQHYSRACIHAQISRLGPSPQAAYLYEYARICGSAGDYAESERCFSEVLALIDKAGGEAETLRVPTLVTYSRQRHVVGQHAAAVQLHERSLAVLEKRAMEASDPLGFALFLDSYAFTLRAAGLSERAESASAQSAALKEKGNGGRIGPQGRRYKAG